MSDDTPILSLPLILPAQAQKHVTHNEALRILDILVQLAVQDRDRSAPPASPTEGARHIIASGATGLWAGRDGQIAPFWAGDWFYLSPQDGWIAQVTGEGKSVIRREGQWVVDVADQMPKLGVNATADATNRLAVAAPASLFTHEGAGHQLKINKAEASATASLLFQTDWQGRAELGLAGEEDVSLKVSADGATFTTALRVDRTTGTVSLPQGAAVTGSLTGTAVTQSRSDGTAGRVLKNFDHGLGARTASEVALRSAMEDSDARNGFFATNAATTGTVPEGSTGGGGLVLRQDATKFVELHADPVNARLHLRGRNGATYSAWQRVLTLAGLLGQVGLTDGQPNGAVLNYSSGNSGQCLQLADGTQICWHRLTLGSITASGAGSFASPFTTDGTASWTFPTRFSATPTLQGQAVAPTAASGLRRAAVVSFGAVGVSSAADIRAIRIGAASEADLFAVDLLAIGRWA